MCVVSSNKPNRRRSPGRIARRVTSNHQAISRALKKSASSVLASSKSSTGTRPPHHSAARTDVVLLIRRTVRPRGYASGLHSLRPCWTAFLSILRECSPVVPHVLTVEALAHQNSFFHSQLTRSLNNS